MVHRRHAKFYIHLCKMSPLCTNNYFWTTYKMQYWHSLLQTLLPLITLLCVATLQYSTCKVNRIHTAHGYFFVKPVDFSVFIFITNLVSSVSQYNLSELLDWD